ncbi:MAG: DUF5657 family protein [Microgenomates group bacterium]
MEQIINILNIKNIIHYSFKPLAILISFLYVIFALIVLKQTEVMNKTLNSSANIFFNFISLLQLIFAVIVLLVAIFLI